MRNDDREFDSYGATYDTLLRDPLRHLFSPAGTGFFQRRKSELITARFSRRGIGTRNWDYLDMGCGRGELLDLLSPGFASATGCDPSAGMLHAGGSKNVRLQPDPLRLPFPDASFHFVTAACVYHHVAPQDRAAVTREVHRVLAPGGTFCIIEHNPLNPVTRIIVARSPVDVDAHLLSHWRTRTMLRDGGFEPAETSFFMYLPESIYDRAPGPEATLARLPLGGQYASFARRGP